jgi:hypothetical protein
LIKRRALSTVIGVLFFVIVMASTISYVGYSMDLIGNLAEAVTVKQDQNFNRQNEEFKITDARVDFNEFNLTVKNTGTIPINITRMWAQNITDSSWNQTKYQLNQIVSPGGLVSNIGQGTGLVALDSESYGLKLVTERGNSLLTQVLSGSRHSIEMTLFHSPASPLTNQNVTLLFSVKNNLTDGSIIKSLVPDFRPPTTTGAATAVQQGPTMPTIVEGLKPGETAIFEATYLVSGDLSDKIIFNATVANAVQGNFVTDLSEIDIAEVSESTINESVNEILGIQIGILSMNFTTFQACIPAASNCESDSLDWIRAWDIETNKKYLYRINFTNNGLLPIILEKSTHILQISSKTGGGGTSVTPFFIRDPSTTSNENPGKYTDFSITLPADGSFEVTMYFGGVGWTNNNMQSTDPNPGSVAVFMVLFGYQDLTDDGKTPDDTPYGQTLPFQSFRIS